MLLEKENDYMLVFGPNMYLSRNVVHMNGLHVSNGCFVCGIRSSMIKALVKGMMFKTFYAGSQGKYHIQ